MREGSLEAPIRYPLDWKNPDFYDKNSLNQELARVFDVCHGCRRCVNLCNSFPTLFDLVDQSTTMEVDGVEKNDYQNVVDQCYLCDLCYLTKCPYVPPHEWNVDFPHLMLRAKAIKYRNSKTETRDKILSNTGVLGKLASIPVVTQAVNAFTQSAAGKKALHKNLGIHSKANIPVYQSITARKLLKKKSEVSYAHSKVVLFITCYHNYIEPGIVQDLVKVFEHNHVSVSLLEDERCCGMPKLELGDLQAVEKLKEANIPTLIKWINRGYDIVAPVPSCVLMFKQALPLMFPDDVDVQQVKTHMYDPFEYLLAKHKQGVLKTEFKNSLGKVFYHAPCHLRVQNIGLKTRDLLSLIPDTTLEVIERCSGHDGTYGVKSEFHETARKICRPVVAKLKKSEANYYTSDCSLAGHHIANVLDNETNAVHPMSLLCKAYGI